MSESPPEQAAEGGSEAWNYLVYRLLTRLEEEQHSWRSVTSSQFSKLPCIADRYLIDELGLNIDFPRYWYKYGEVGNRDPLDNTLFIQEEAEDWGGLKIRPAKPEADFDLDPNLKSNIDQAIDFVVEKFANVKIDSIKDLQYEYFAPNEFIKQFERLRTDIYELAEIQSKNREIEEPESKNEELISLLHSLEEEYDEELYEEMYEDFQRWNAKMQDVIQKGEYGKAEAYLEEFWDVFSKVHLRIEHNNNPIEDQLRRWKVENDFELEKYRKSFENDTD